MPRTKDNAKREEGKSADKARGPGKSKGRVAHTGTADTEANREATSLEEFARRNPSLAQQETRRTPPPEELPSSERKGQEKLKGRVDKVVDELRDILESSTDPILNTKLRDCVRTIQR